MIYNLLFKLEIWSAPQLQLYLCIYVGIYKFREISISIMLSLEKVVTYLVVSNISQE